MKIIIVKIGISRSHLQKKKRKSESAKTIAIDASLTYYTQAHKLFQSVCM